MGVLSGRQFCNLDALRGHILHIELSSLRGRIPVIAHFNRVGLMYMQVPTTLCSILCRNCISGQSRFDRRCK